MQYIRLMVLLTLSLQGYCLDGENVKTVVTKWMEALKVDGSEKSLKFMYSSNGPMKENSAYMVLRNFENVIKKDGAPKIVKIGEFGNTGAAILENVKGRKSPVVVMKIDGEWKVLLPWSDYNGAPNNMDDNQISENEKVIKFIDANK